MKPVQIILLIGGAILLMAASTVPGAAGLPASLFDLINKWETGGDINKYLKAYTDTGGVWTIGYGSIYNYDKQRPVSATDKIDQPTAMRWFLNEMTDTVNTVKSLVKVPITERQLSALSSFAYNVGTGKQGFGGSTLLKLLNAGKPKETVAAEFDKWVYDNGKRIQGLVNRRADEKRIFLS